jgi:hypothetical protein
MSWRKSRAALMNGDFRALFEAFSAGAGDLAATLAPGAAPGEAHLVGKAASAKREAEQADPLDLRLDALEREIAGRRHLGDG